MWDVIGTERKEGKRDICLRFKITLIMEDVGSVNGSEGVETEMVVSSSRGYQGRTNGQEERRNSESTVTGTVNGGG